MIRLTVFLCCCFAVWFAPTTQAAVVVDQSELTSTIALGPINPDPLFGQISGQSFTTGMGVTNIAGGRIVLQSGLASLIELELYDISSLGTNPPALASATVGPQTPGTIEILFSTPVAVTENTQYFFAFRGGVGDTGQFGGSIPGAYAGGDALTNPNFGSVTVFNGTGGTGEFDFAFESLTDDSFVAVPEPSGILFCATALCVGLARRRRTA